MKLNLTRILLAAIMTIPLVSQAARPLGAPIAEFFSQHNRIACGVVVEILDQNKIMIRTEDYLYQSDDEVVTITVNDEVFADVKVGSEYLVVFSRQRKDPLFRDAWEVDPEGPHLVKTRGLGTPAIYENNDSILALLTPAGTRDERSLDSETTLLLNLAENTKDERARELGIFELHLRKDLQTSISSDNAQRYAQIINSVNPKLKGFLLQGAKNFPEERRTQWLGQAFRRPITIHGTQLDLNSYVPALLKNSLLGLTKEGTPDDLDVITKHLYSNAPGVAKAALTALNAIDPKQALVRAKQALQADDEIHLVTRRALVSYVKSNTGA